MAGRSLTIFIRYVGLQMRREFLRKIFSGSLDEGFDATKKISDYVGMITRLVFLSVISAFVADTMDYSALSEYSATAILRAVFLFLLLVVNVLFGVAFICISKNIMWATFRLNKPAASGRFQRIAFEVFQPMLAGLMIVGIIAIAISTPLVVSELASRQMHRDVKPQVNAAPAQ